MKHGYLALSNCDSYVDIIININGLLRYPYKPSKTAQGRLQT